MLKDMKTHWKRAVSGLLAVVMAAGMLPTAAFAAETASAYAPTGDFELNVAGSTAWNNGDQPLAIYKTESGTAQITTIPTSTAFALLEDNGGDRIKIGYASEGGWTGSDLDGTGWADKESILVNLPDVLPSIAYVRDAEKQFSSRLTRWEYVVPCSYALAEQLAQLQKAAMSSGETLVVRQAGQTVSVSQAEGDPTQLHSYSLDGATYQKYDTWTEPEAAEILSYDLPRSIDLACSADPSITLTKFCPQTVRRAPAIMTASEPTGGVGAHNPGSPGGSKPSTSNVSWSSDHEQTFLRFTLIEFPNGVVTDLNTTDWSTWHVAGTPLNVFWNIDRRGNAWSVDKVRSDITWYNSSAMQYNAHGENAPQLISGTVYAYDATSNPRWVTTADEFQRATGITDDQKEQMFHCSSSSWSTGWLDGDYTSMWGTDAESVTPGNLYKVYKANDAFLYLLKCLSSNGIDDGWSEDEAMEKWSEYVHDADGNLRTKYRIIVETGCVFNDPDGYLRAYTLRDMMAYTLYNHEPQERYNLIWDQASTADNMAQWMRQAVDNQFLEYPLDENGVPTGEELHSINGFTECDSFVDTIHYARPIRDKIFTERRSFGLHIFSPFNFESEPTVCTLDVTKKAGTEIPAGEEWGFTVNYTAGSPTGFTATKNDVDCTSQVTDTGSSLKFNLKADETIRIRFDADSSFRYVVTEDDSSQLTNITGTGGTADMAAKTFSNTSGAAKVIFTNGTPDTPTPPSPPEPPTPTTPTSGRAILYKRDANTNAGVGPAAFKFSSVTNGVYEFDTNASGELEPIQWWDPTEAAGKYIKPGEYAVSEIIPPPNYLPTTEVQQIKLELDASGNPIPAGPLVFKNLAKVGLKIVKYDRLSHTPMNNVTFEIFKDGVSIGRYETKGNGEIILTDIEPGTYRAVEVDTGDDSHIKDTAPQEIELTAGCGVKELFFFNDVLPGMKLVKVDSADPSKTIPNAKFRIRAVDGSYGPQEFTTNGSGEIDLSMLPTGSYEVTEVECAGYVIDEVQRIIHLRANDTAQFVFTNTRKPSFKLVKTSADGTPLDGVTFRIAPIEDASRSIDRTTQNGGEILVEGLEPGIYSVLETATLPNHVLDKTEYHVELSPGKTSELRIQNDKKPVLTLSKIDADSQQPIPNTVFTVKALDSTYQDDWKTGSDGKVSKIVDPGVYEITEKSVPSPYYIPDKDANRTQTITLSANDEKTLTFRNRKAPEITVFKENSITKDPIEHAKFHITYTSNGEAADAPATIDYGYFFTDSRGEIRLHEQGKRLYPGEFEFTEVEPADGFQLKEPLTQKVIVHGNESKRVVFQNTPLSALIVWKYDSVTGAPVEGCVFQVKYMSGTSGSGGTVIGTYKTGPNGSFTVNRLEAGAYLIEELASDGDHVMDTAPQTAYISGKEQDVVELYFGNSPKGAVLIKKIDASTHEPLSDVEFFITDSHGTMLGDANGKFVTDSAGTILISNLDPGITIVARETRAKENYILDDVPQTITIQAGRTSTLEFRNQPKGSVTLYKFSSSDRRTPLEGVGFKITYADGRVVDNIGGKLSSNGIYYSDSEGQINISGVTGTLIFSEISTIPGYLIDENRKSQTIVVNPDDHQSVYFYNIPENTLIIEKYLETESGNEPLKGVTFQVTDSSGAVVGSSNGEFITGEDGRIVIDGVAPGTTVTAREIKVPDGVVLDSTPKTIKIGDKGANTLRFYNKKTGYLVIRKLDKVTRAPLSGVEFELTYADGSFVDDNYGHLSSKGRFVTNDAGEIRVPVVGTVVVKELTPCLGYVIDPATQIQTITVNPADTQTMVVYNDPLCSLTISKVDAVTGKPVPNTEFTLKDGDGNVLGRYTTGTDGTVTVTGLIPNSTVVVVESKVPSNYVLDPTPHTIIVRNGSNSVSTGTASGGSTSGNGNGGSGGNNITVENLPKTTLTIEKYLETETGNVPLKGVTFLVTDSSGAVIGPNNGEYISDENGRIVIPNLEPGITVTAREISVPDGVVLDSTPKSIKIEGGIGGQTLRFVNQKAGTLVIRKLDKLTGKPLANVEFELTYAEGGYVDDANGHLSSKGLFTTNANGEIRVSVTGTVVAKETKCLPGYTMDPATSIQAVTVNPADTQTITVYNTPGTNLTIQKYIENPDAPGTGTEPLAGAVFLITDSAGTPLGPNNGEYVTDKNGQILLTSLTPGTTITACEVRVPSSEFVLDGTPQSILIKEGTEGQQLTFYNKRVGGLELIKVSESDKTQRIPNVTFEIRKMDGALVDTVTTDSTGRVHVDLSAGDFYAVEIDCPSNFKLDSTPHYFTVEDNKCTTLTVTNKAFSGILIHKTDSVTGKGIYGVSFLLYNSANTPIGQYTSDNSGYVYIEGLIKSGRYYLRELENKGYIPDTQMKAVYVTAGETTLIEWKNTPITAQIQITKKSADYNPTNGLPAGTLLEGAIFEIYDKAGNLVDTIRSDSRGLAASKPLPLNRYTIREVKAPDNYGVSDQELTAYLEHEGQIVRFEVTNKALATGVSITKTGPSEIMAGQPVRYIFSNIANNSNVRLDSFYWRDVLPAEVRLETVVTGTYNFPGTYKITYRVNGGEPRTLADNLSTSKNYALAASATALGLAGNERVTEIMFVFGQAPGGFAQVEKPMLYCTALKNIAGTSFVNVADVGGVYNGQWVQAVSRWVTKVYGTPIIPTLPRTGY